MAGSTPGTTQVVAVCLHIVSKRSAMQEWECLYSFLELASSRPRQLRCLPSESNLNKWCDGLRLKSGHFLWDQQFSKDMPYTDWCVVLLSTALTAYSVHRGKMKDRNQYQLITVEELLILMRRSNVFEKLPNKPSNYTYLFLHRLLGEIRTICYKPIQEEATNVQATANAAMIQKSDWSNLSTQISLFKGYQGVDYREVDPGSCSFLVHVWNSKQTV